MGMTFRFLEHPGAKKGCAKHSLATDSPGAEREKIPVTGTHAACAETQGSHVVLNRSVWELMEPAVRKQIRGHLFLS